MNLINRREILRVLKHFKSDLNKYGIYFLNYPSDNEKAYPGVCKFGKWPRQDLVNPLWVGGRQVKVWFAHTNVFGSYTEWKTRPEGIQFCVDESLDHSYCGRSMIIGSALLNIVEDWGFNHGKFMHRSDSNGIYFGPHEKYPSLPRPHGTVSKFFLIHPEIYQYETR